MFTEVHYRQDGDTAWITLNRPHKRNAISSTMVAELGEALGLAAGAEDARAIVITGAGTAFCAGADLAEMATGLDDGPEPFLARFLRPLADVMLSLRRSPLPVIAAVNGPCAAGGLELVLSCDFILASPTATFTDAHSQRGIAPAIGGVAALVAAVGSFRAARILLASETISATTMQDWGLLTVADDVIGAAQDLATGLGRRSPASIRTMKAMLARAQGPTWEQHVEADLADFRTGWADADMREGLAAYLERRTPTFTG